VETIAQSGNLEKIKFMEGASWVANKSMQEANKLNQKLESLLHEYERRANNCVVDANINEIDGLEFLKLRDWTCDFLGKEATEVQIRFETLLENVNYNMSQANAALKPNKK